MGAGMNSSRNSRRARAPAALCVRRRSRKSFGRRSQLKPSGVRRVFETFDDGRARERKAAGAKFRPERLRSGVDDLMTAAQGQSDLLVAVFIRLESNAQSARLVRAEDLDAPAAMRGTTPQSVQRFKITSRASASCGARRPQHWGEIAASRSDFGRASRPGILVDKATGVMANKPARAVVVASNARRGQSQESPARRAPRECREAMASPARKKLGAREACPRLTRYSAVARTRAARRAKLFAAYLLVVNAHALGDAH